MVNARYKMTQTCEITCADSSFGQSIEKDVSDVIYYDGEKFWFESNGYEACFVDGVYYYRFGDGKIKMTVGEDFEEIEEAIGTKLAAMGVKNLGEYESVEKTENADGTITLVLTSPKDINALCDTVLGGLGLGQMMSVSVGEESFKQTIIIDAEGRYESVELNMTITVALDIQGDSEESVTANCKMNMEFDYSEGKEITAPADAAEYKEIPLMNN
jgi:hypothetical protein